METSMDLNFMIYFRHIPFPQHIFLFAWCLCNWGIGVINCLWSPTLLAWLTRGGSFSCVSPPYPAPRRFPGANHSAQYGSFRVIAQEVERRLLCLVENDDKWLSFQEAESWSTWGSNSSPKRVVGWPASFVYCFMEVNESERQNVLQDEQVYKPLFLLKLCLSHSAATL